MSRDVSFQEDSFPISASTMNITPEVIYEGDIFIHMTVDITVSSEATASHPLNGPEISSSDVHEAPTVLPDIASGTSSTTGDVSPTPAASASPDPCATTPHRELPCIPVDGSTVRRSFRPSKTPGWLNGFQPPGESSEANVVYRYPFTDYMSYATISPLMRPYNIPNGVMP